MVRIFGHTHGNIHTFIAPLLAAVLVFSVSTPQALALEATLPNSPTPKMTMPAVLRGVTLPTYGYTAGSALSAASPVTKAGIRDVVVVAPAPQLPLAEATTSGSPVLVMEGEASFYSRAGCLGCNPGRIMANGQPLNDNALTMAIGADKKHLVGRTARVTSLVTGKSTTVRITDTGGFHAAKYGHRVADLTIATKQAIGMAGGVGQVRVEVL